MHDSRQEGVVRAPNLPPSLPSVTTKSAVGFMVDIADVIKSISDEFC